MTKPDGMVATVDLPNWEGVWWLRLNVKTKQPKTTNTESWCGGIANMPDDLPSLSCMCKKVPFAGLGVAGCMVAKLRF